MSEYYENLNDRLASDMECLDAQEVAAIEEREAYHMVKIAEQLLKEANANWEDKAAALFAVTPKGAPRAEPLTAMDYMREKGWVS